MFGGFAIVALAISIVGVAGVLAFSVSGRTREFRHSHGDRIAAGRDSRHRAQGRSGDGGGIGVAVGIAGGFAMARAIGSVVQDVQLPGALPILGAAILLLVAAMIASALPAARAARVDVVQALRAD